MKVAFKKVNEHIDEGMNYSSISTYKHIEIKIELLL